MGNTSSFKNQIKQSLKSGATLDISFGNISENAAPLYEAPVLPYEIPLDITINSIQEIAGVIGGRSMQTLIPNGLLPAIPHHTMTLSSVNILLEKIEQQVLKFECSISFGNSGLPWNVIPLGKGITMKILTLDIGVSQPTSLKNSTLYGSVHGTIQIGSFELECSLDFPGTTISICLPPDSQFNLSALFDHFSWTGLSFPENLLLSYFNLYVDVGQKSFLLNSVVETEGLKPLTLIPAISGSKEILSINQLGLSIAYAPNALNGQLSGSLLFMENLALDVRAGMNVQSGSWSFSGNINIPATAQNLGIKPVNGKYSVSIIKLIEECFDVTAPNFPEAIQNLGIASLQIDYTYSKTGGEANKSYSFQGALASNWKLAGTSMSAAVEVLITKNESSETKSISADFEMDGFSFCLSCALNDEEKLINTSVKADIQGDKLEISGTYDESNNTVTLKFKQTPSLSTLLGWFIQELTGNRYFELPTPWNELLSQVKIPDGTKLTINTKTKEVSCTVNKHIRLPWGSIDSATIQYTPPSNGKSKANGLRISLQGDFPWTSGNSISWNPATEQPPGVPGQGDSFVDLQLLALGQHVALKNLEKPYTIQNVVGELKSAVTSLEGNSSPAVQFSKESGWLIGAHALFLGQADVQLVFMDPELYGLLVQVNRGKNETLNKLAGLRAEILYRKVNETVGEYHGALTLPDSIRRMRFGNALLTLPSISVSIYTNGDFAFDIGFPYNLDFSHSFSVTADSFTGAGGFYYAKLNGLHPKSLPQVTNGAFTSITELGVGFRVGRAVAFQQGPLSASASIVLEALFQGVFATFVKNETSEEYEYYSIQASIAIVAHLSGKINFSIIQASLNVTAMLRADASLVAYEPCHVTITASVDVEITVRIDLGLFSIHIHCSFSTTFQTQATLSSLQSGSAPWQIEAAQHKLRDSTSLDDLQLQRQYSDSATKVYIFNKVIIPKIWQPITATSPLALAIDVLPQPTSTGPDDWFYVCQLAMNLNDPSYENLVKGLLVWTLYNLTSPTSGTDYSVALNTAVSLDQVKQFQKSLQQEYKVIAPTLNDIKALFQQTNGKALFETTIACPTKAVNQYKAAFFPIFPGISVTVKSSKASSQSPPAVQPGEPDQSIQNIQEQIFIDYTLLVISTALDKAVQLGAFATNSSVMIRDILNTLSSGSTPTPIESIAGLTTRFMLHGTRIKNNTIPLYEATGQQKPVALSVDSTDSATGTFNQVPAQSISMYISAKNGTGVGIPLTPIFLQSGVPNDSTSLIRKPATFLGTNAPTLNLEAFTALSYLPLTHRQEQQYPFKTGINVTTKGTGSAQSLWHFSASLNKRLYSGKTLPQNCTLMQVPVNSTTGVVHGSPTVVSGSQYVLMVDFKVKLIPLPVAKGKKPGYLKNTYLLKSVNPLGLLRLEQLIQNIQSEDTQSILNKLQLSYTSKAGEAVMAEVNPTSLFLMQSNFSTETNPPPTGLINTTDIAEKTKPTISPEFIYKLWTGGITNSGGFYLFWGGKTPLPDSVFDQEGMAELTLVASLKHVKSYATGVLVNALTSKYGGKSRNFNLYISDSGHQVTRGLYDPGMVPSRVTKTAQTGTDGTHFKDTINHQYNLLKMSCDLKSDTQIVSPKNGQDSAKNEWHYDHVFDPVPKFKANGSGTPPADMNPYQFINGKTVPNFTLKPVDLFGNEWAPVTPLENDIGLLSYTDPLMSLSQLPYLHIDYSFKEENGDIEVQFKVHFPAYGSGSNEQPLTQKETDLYAYAKCIYQLGNAGVTTNIKSSFARGLTPNNLKEQILERIEQIYAALDQSNTPKPSINPIAVPVDRTQLKSGTFFQLNVALEFRRTKYVNTAFGNESAVACIKMTIPPSMKQDTGKPQSIKSLAPFASAFEEAYKGQHMKIAVGPTGREDASSNAQQIWVMRYGVQGNIDLNFEIDQYNQVEYFTYSPRPLSNKLISRSGIPVNGTSGETITVTNVDLDAEMRIFLSAIDDIFSPEMMTPASIINREAVNSLSSCKQEIVSNLMEYVTYSQNTGSGNDEAKRAAKDRYKQECLKELSNFYKMDAVVVFKTCKNSDLKDILNFQGKLTISDAKKAEATLTTAKAAAPNNSKKHSYIAFGIFPKQLTNRDYFVADVSFHLNALEHSITPISIPMASGQTYYEAGSWLKFVLPLEDISMGQKPIRVPLPLRAFPTPPNLGVLDGANLAATMEKKDFNDRSAQEQMLLAKAWSLNGEYYHDYVAQDLIETDVEIKAIHDPTNHVLDHKQSRERLQIECLIESLIQFKHAYPELKGILSTISTVNNPTSGQRTLSQALDSLKTLVEKIASSLQPVNEAVDRSSVKNSFKIEGKKAVDETAKWQIEVALADPPNTLNFIPQVAIPGYTLANQPAASLDEITYTYKSVNTNPSETGPEKIAKRTFIGSPLIESIPKWPVTSGAPYLPLNILTHQHGQLSFKVIRNSQFASAFRYETSYVRYKSPIQPLLEVPVDRVINVSGLNQGSDKSMKAYIQCLFDAIRTDYFTGEKITTGQFQAVVSFQYNSNKNDLDLAPINIPVLMRVPTLLDENHYVDQIAEALDSWVANSYGSLDNLQSDASLSDPRFNFELSVFIGNSTSNGSPVLRIRSLRLNIVDITS